MDLFFTGTAAIIFFSIVFICSILWIIALVDIVRSNFRGQYDKLIWVLIVLFAPLLGAILYFIIGRGNKVNHN